MKQSALWIVILLAGCLHHIPQPIVEYEPSSTVPGLKAVKHAGDFALFYDSNRKPEIPVRLAAGEMIGFVQLRDGGIQAVAGAFRMDLSSDAGRAYWRRIAPRE